MVQRPTAVVPRRPGVPIIFRSEHAEGQLYGAGDG
jgi:hypothetical protein